MRVTFSSREMRKVRVVTGLVGITALRPARFFILLLCPILTTVVVSRDFRLHELQTIEHHEGRRGISLADSFVVYGIRCNGVKPTAVPTLPEVLDCLELWKGVLTHGYPPPSMNRRRGDRNTRTRETRVVKSHFRGIRVRRRTAAMEYTEREGEKREKKFLCVCLFSLCRIFVVVTGMNG